MELTRENRFLTSTDWEGYLKILEALKERRVKVTYDRGALELMSPSRLHERTKTIVAALLEAWMLHQGVDGEGGGSTTFRRVLLDRGLEPDECYWIRQARTARSSEEIDPEDLPIPDVVVEIEVSRSALDRLSIYAVLGVPEVWRWTSEGRLAVHVLTQPGVYDISPTSPTFPTLPLPDFERFVHIGLNEGQMPAVRQFVSWIQQLS